MRKRIVISIIYILFSVVASVAAPYKFTLVIDAGHGGKDAGAIGAISKEKDINLRTALAFGGYVERNCPDVRVIYTRKTDVFVTLHGRAEIANKAKADLFMSIHTNALDKGKMARGFETYTLGMHKAGENLDVAKRENSVILVENDYKQRYAGFDPNSAESYIMFEFMQDHNMSRSVELAKDIQKSACSVAGRQNKGVKQAGFLVLRETTMPSCLIELGYISTRDEEQWLNSESNINTLARGIFQGFLNYRSKYDNSVSSNIKIQEPKKQSEPEVKPDTMRKQSTEKVRAEIKENNSVKPATPVPARSSSSRDDSGKPVFKIQIFVSDKVLTAKDSRLKGENADYFKEGKMLKYTIGASTNYNEIYQLRKKLLTKFPDSFIVAFKNGDKMNVNEAIKEFKNSKK